MNTGRKDFTYLEMFFLPIPNRKELHLFYCGENYLEPISHKADILPTWTCIVCTISFERLEASP